MFWVCSIPCPHNRILKYRSPVRVVEYRQDENPIEAARTIVTAVSCRSWLACTIISPCQTRSGNHSKKLREPGIFKGFKPMVFAPDPKFHRFSGLFIYSAHSATGKCFAQGRSTQWPNLMTIVFTFRRPVYAWAASAIKVRLRNSVCLLQRTGCLCGVSQQRDAYALSRV